MQIKLLSKEHACYNFTNILFYYANIYLCLI